MYLKIIFFTLLFAFNLLRAATLSLESGSVTIDNSETAATCKTFRQTYAIPPVVYVMMDTTGPNNAIIKLTNVSTTQFCAKVMETIFFDGPHNPATVNYIAIPQGVYRLPDGTKVEAGIKTISNVINDDRISDSWTSLTFSHAYSQSPSVITQLQTMNNELPEGAVSSTARGNTNDAISIPWITESVNNITSSSAQIALDKSHIIETGLSITKSEKVGYFIIESNKLGSFTASDNNPVYYQTFLTGNVFGGYYTNGTPCNTISINTLFPTSGYLFVASKAINNSSYGGWMRKCSQTNRNIGLLIDSKQSKGSGKISGNSWTSVGNPDYGLSTRDHPLAPASIAVFSRSFDLSRVVNDANLSVNALVQPSTVIESGSLTMDVNVSNKGPDSAPNTILSLSLPSGMTFQQITSGGANWSCAQNSNALDCNLTSGALAANTTSMLSLKFSAPSIANFYTVNVSAASDGLDDDGAGTTAQFQVYNLLVDDDKAECPTASFTTISSALNMAHSGDTLRICKGTYTENIAVNVNDINITSNSGIATDVIVKGSSSNAFTLNKSNVGIKNLSIVQNVSNSRAVLADNAANLTLDNLVISYTNGSNEAIKLQNSSTTPILKNLTITSDQSGIKMDGANGFALTNLNITAGSNSGNYGIYGWNINTTSSLSQITVQSGDNAIQIVSGQKITMTDINAASSTARAIYVPNGTFSLGISTWASNTLVAQLIALQADNAGAFSVQNTNASSTADTVMKFANVGNNAFTFTDNNITGNSTNSYGVYIDGGGSASIIQRNIIKNATTNQGLRLLNNPTFSSKISNNCFMNNLTHNANVSNSGNSQFNGNFWGTTAELAVAPDYTDVAALSYCPLTPDPVLIANYRFDECIWNGTTDEVADSSGNGYNGTALNSLNTVSTGKVCRGTTFNGTDQYISAPGIANYLQKTASLSFWIKTTQIGDNTNWLAPGITGVEQAGGNNDIFWGWIDGSGKIGLNAFGDSTQAKSTMSINDGTWRHIVLTRDAATGLLQIYINGILNASGTGGAGTVGTSFSSIGRIEDTGGTPAYFNGSLDEIKIFDRVLSSSDVATIYNNETASKNYDGTTRTCTECAPPPLAEYRFDECSWNGTLNEILDSSGNNYPATFFNTGASTEENATAQGGTCRVSKLGGNAYLQIASTFPNLTTDFSITGWFNSSNIAKTGQRIFIDDQSNTRGYGLSVNDDGNRYVRFYDRSQPNSGTIDATAAPLVSNQWYFAAAVTDVTQSLRHLYVYNSSGTLLDHKTMSITGNIGTDSSPASMGGETNSGETGNRFQGYQDEIKVFDKALSQSQVSLIALNEAHHFNYDGTARTCETCVTPPTDCSSFTYNIYHPPSTTNKLLTRIAQENFDVNVSIACIGTGTIPARQIKKIYAVTGACPTSTAGLPILWNGSADINSTVNPVLLTVPAASNTKAYSNIKLMIETNSSELNCSSDNFAIRPPSFSITSPSVSAKAAAFTLQISANNSGTGYNGTANVNTGLQTLNPNCPISNGFLKSSLNPAEPLLLTFQTDTNSSTVRAIEVGTIYLNTKDTSWTAVDQSNDCIVDSNTTIMNAQGLVGCNIENNLSLSITPDHFDVNGTLSNFGNGFTYLSDDLNMSAQLNLIITAENDANATTQNYTSGCYSKDTTITLPHSVLPSPLSKILYHDSITLSDVNITGSNPITSTYNSTKFTQGFITPQITFNFDRDKSKPLNPFDFTFNSATVTDPDTTGIGTPLGTAKFVYGRVHAYDVTTNISPAPNPIEFEVYSTTSSGFVSGMPQNVLHWYRNLNHDAANQGNVIQGGFSAGTVNSNVNVSTAPQEGIQIINVTSTADQTVHLDISKWLWYSSNYGYLYSGACTKHPCFNYDYTDASAGVKGVNSGTFKGSDFQMTPAKNITNKGVKIFR